MIRTAALALLLTGCVHSTRYLGPSGQQMVAVHCGGCMLDFGDCFNRAREECGGDFVVANQQSGIVYAASANAYGASVTPVATRDLVVECRAGAPERVMPGVPVNPASAPQVQCPADDECESTSYCTPIGT